VFIKEKFKNQVSLILNYISKILTSIFYLPFQLKNVSLKQTVTEQSPVLTTYIKAGWKSTPGILFN
jgi:hypothetical protein